MALPLSRRRLRDCGGGLLSLSLSLALSLSVWKGSAWTAECVRGEAGTLTILHRDVIHRAPLSRENERRRDRVYVQCHSARLRARAVAFSLPCGERHTHRRSVRTPLSTVAALGDVIHRAPLGRRRDRDAGVWASVRGSCWCVRPHAQRAASDEAERGFDRT